MKVDILAFGAHPDDVELGCGGTIAKSIYDKKSVGIIDLTQGEMGTNGSVQIRHEEANKAATILGVNFRKNLKFKDVYFKNDEAHQIKIIELIRLHKPDIVLCNATQDRHIDHGRGSDLVSHSCFLSGLSKLETSDNLGHKQTPWRPKVVYHYIQWNEIEPDFVVDVSGFIDKKILAVKAFSSQFYSSDDSRESTPISSLNFIESVKYRSLNLGRIIGVEAGEGFTSERYPSVKSISDLI
tara:strand:+ start:7294 stop:8013 length:720 start_codon:yes stop_codon:yes gene_type:complete